MLLNQHWRILISKSTSKVFRSINLQSKHVKRTDHFLSSQIGSLNVLLLKAQRAQTWKTFWKETEPTAWLESWFHLTACYQMGESHSLLLSPCSKPLGPMPSFTVFLVFIDLLTSQFTSLNQQEFSFIIFSGHRTSKRKAVRAHCWSGARVIPFI